MTTIERRRRGAGFLLISLTACSVDSQYDANYVSRELAERSGSMTRPVGEDQVLPPAIDLHDGLDQAEAVAIALWNNQAFAAVLADLDVSRAELQTAGAFRNPALSTLLPLGPGQFELTLSMPLDALLQRPHRLAAARADVERVALELVRSGLDLIRDTQLAFASAVYASDRTELADATAQLAQRRGNMALLRATAGDLSEAQAAAANLAAGRARHEAKRAAHEARQARQRLHTLLGIPQGFALPVLVADPVGPAPPPLAALLESARTARPDLLAAERALVAAGERIGLSRNELWQFSLLAKVAEQTGGTDEISLGFAGELPLFDWHRGAMAKADAELRRSALRWTALQHSVAGEIAQAWHDEVAARAEVSDLRDSLLPASASEIASATQLVASGDESEDVLLEARQHELELQTAVATTTWRLREAHAALARAVGRRVDA